MKLRPMQSKSLALVSIFHQILSKTVRVNRTCAILFGLIKLNSNWKEERLITVNTFLWLKSFKFYRYNTEKKEDFWSFLLKIQFMNTGASVEA